MTKKQEDRFFKDMKDPDKQEKYKKFVEREQTAYKLKKEAESNGDG